MSKASLMSGSSSRIAMLAPAKAMADFAAGMVAARDGDFATALVEWEPLAATGDMDAQTNLGMMYERGAGVERDPAMALVLFTAAANQGHSLAAYKVGLAHQLGLGIPVDFAAALTRNQVTAAAKMGIPAASMNWAIRITKAKGWLLTHKKP